MSKKLTPVQKALQQLIRQIARDEETSPQGALRDILTDLLHVSRAMRLNFDFAVGGAHDVFHEEVGLEQPSMSEDEE